MYTVIIHPLRKTLKLSMNEFAVLESIRSLSNNIEYSGWCVISRENLSKALDLSKPTIVKIYDTLDKKGLIVKNKLGHARPVDWYIRLFNPDSEINIQIAKEHDVLSAVKKLTTGKETLPGRLNFFTDTGKETLPYNTKDNTSNNTKDKVERIKEFKLEVLKFTPEYSVDMLKDFFEYWSESGDKQKKLRFEKQTVFDISRRLKTWSNNQKNFRGKSERDHRIHEERLSDDRFEI